MGFNSDFKLFKRPFPEVFFNNFNPLNAELNPICHLLALLRARHILHISRIRVKQSTKKSNFRKLFRNCTSAQKPLYVPVDLILNLKKGMCFPHVSSIFKNVSPKTFVPHCVYRNCSAETLACIVSVALYG